MLLVGLSIVEGADNGVVDGNNIVNGVVDYDIEYCWWLYP